jgi:uncharacterized protein YecE (DUF72 family)
MAVKSAAGAGRPASGSIRAGMGGWTFEPWDKSFYPEKLGKAKQLNYASRQVPTIEVNGTYYSTFKPETFAKWAADAPDGFVFSLKGNRFITNRRVLAEAGESVERFLRSGITELGEKLGPLLWQLAPTKKLDPDDFTAFLKLLPERHAGVRLRHAVEVRHPSFSVPEFVTAMGQANAAIVYADHPTYPAIADVTGDFVYARLQTGSDEVETCYAPKELDGWADRVRRWAAGKVPDDLPRADPARKTAETPRDVFVYFIHSGKVRAPHGAMALMERVTA